MLRRALSGRALMCVCGLLVAQAGAQTMTVYTTTGDRYTYDTQDVNRMGFAEAVGTKGMRPGRQVTTGLHQLGAIEEGRFALTAPAATEYTFDVYDLLGKRIYTTSGAVPAAARAAITVPGGITSGICIVKVTCGDFNATRRFTAVN